MSVIVDGHPVLPIGMQLVNKSTHLGHWGVVCRVQHEKAHCRKMKFSVVLVTPLRQYIAIIIQCHCVQGLVSAAQEVGG